jgi:signal peptidase II
VIKDIVTLTKVENTGAFLSLGNHLPRMTYIIFMIILPLIVIGFALFYLFKNSALSKLIIIGICLVIGGGLGNIFDRIIYSFVTDFFHFDFVIFQTGIVNVADISVTAGFLILIYELLINRNEFKPKNTE